MAYAINPDTGLTLTEALRTIHNGDNGVVPPATTTPASSEAMDTSLAGTPIPTIAEASNNPAYHSQIYGSASLPTSQPALGQKRSVSVSESDSENKKMNRSNYITSENSNKPTELLYNVPIMNRFTELGEQSDERENNRFQYMNEQINDHTNPNIKIPPIFIAHIQNVAEFNKEIKNSITNQFTSIMVNNKLKVLFKNISDFRQAIKYLISTNRKFHTYKDPANKKFSIVFKNLHPSITQEEIYQDLKAKCPSLISVTRLYKDNIPIPVVAAEFDGSQNIDYILQTNQICNLIVKPEKRRKAKGPIQCLRCLDFGHTRNNCNHKINCAICSGNHYTVTCPESKSNPTCILCKGNHRADVRNENCMYYKDIVEKKTTTTFNTRNSFQRATQSSFINQKEQFPSLPPTQPLRNFSRNNHPVIQPGTENNMRSQQIRTQQNQQDNNNNPLLNTIINSISSCIINFINSLIPSIINTIQSAVTAFFNNNNVNTSP